MDTLDKVPPKEKPPLKDRPITQGIIINTIFQIVWTGVPAGIGFLARHYALIYGIQPFWAITMGVLAFFLMALSVNLLRRRRDARALSAATVEALELASPAKLPRAPEKPTIEILSPFDYDEVGLYETVRGRVYPPNQELQVAVFAGDKKWYQQQPVIVRGSTWSVKCKFGRRDKPDEGLYKVVALLGNELKEKIPYSELPTTISSSNFITVHRPEVTIEQELMTVSSERDDVKKQLQSATNAFMDMEAQAEALATENSKLERELVTLKKDKHALEQSLKASQSELDEAIKVADQNLQQEEIQTSNWRQSCNKVEHELAELRWLESRMKKQGEQLDNWVRIKHVKGVKLQLTATPRMIIFAFWVHNGSIFDVTFDFDHLAGRLHFKNRPFNDPVTVPPSKMIDILRPGGGIEIVIEQPLLATEAETVLTAQKIGDPDGIFWLGNLDIPILTIGSPQSFNNHKLRIYSEIELQYVKVFPFDNNS